MGLLSFSEESMSFDEIKEYAEHIREHGLIQFINNYKRVIDRTYDTLKWGDEVRFMILSSFLIPFYLSASDDLY